MSQRIEEVTQACSNTQSQLRVEDILDSKTTDFVEQTSLQEQINQFSTFLKQNSSMGFSQGVMSNLSQIEVAEAPPEKDKKERDPIDVSDWEY